ncbi:MAG: VWA domain-containing protein [Candidatus Tectomicrobia bacterium]|uniref:VWA domain-containing protein n=1 Tax=Tectimicrobiota bacterium TaxID=2528274 RepID=A0A933LQY9_UNCTE|nr:VWA domain-containing protein [Candidatus Tectomicrobia bacterium]
MKRFRYSPWDGTQKVFPMDAEDIIGKLADLFIDSGDFSWALSMMMQEGLTGPDGQKIISGLNDLLEQLKRMRQEYLDWYSSKLPFQQFKQSLDELIKKELERIKRLEKSLQEDVQNQGANANKGSLQQQLQQLLEKLGSPEKAREFLEKLKQQLASRQNELNDPSFNFSKLLSNFQDYSPQARGNETELEDLMSKLDSISALEKFMKRYKFTGKVDLEFEEALNLMEEMEKLEALEKMLRAARFGKDLDEIDVDLIRRVLGEEAAESINKLKELKKVLEEGGYVISAGKRLELTPKGIRKIGEKALVDIFSALDKDQFGQHQIAKRGVGAIKSEETKPYRYGDPFTIDVGRTLMNSLTRTGSGQSLDLRPEDFEVYDTEFQTRSATVVMLDMSWSMIWFNRFFAAKKVAIALNSLIKNQYSRDSLNVVGFYAIAREIPIEELPYVQLQEGVMGTNMKDGFRIAENLLNRNKGCNKQIIMITDGEPTAHFEHGELFFQYPPSHRTLLETLKEVRRCTAQDIVINVFMLSNDYYLREFVNKMTQINKGRAFYTSPEHLGHYLLIDYIQKKRKRIV